MTILPVSLADGECGKGEKKGFSGDTPAPPAEGLPPSCTTREQRHHYDNAYGVQPQTPGKGLAAPCIPLQMKLDKVL